MPIRMSSREAISQPKSRCRRRSSLKVWMKAAQGELNCASVGRARSGTLSTVTSIVAVSSAAMLAMATPRPYWWSRKPAPSVPARMPTRLATP